MNEDKTSSALLEQLVYIDNYINGATSTDSSNATPNLDMDGQLSLDLAAFADDSFIFPDEEKKHNENNMNEGSSNYFSQHQDQNQNQNQELNQRGNNDFNNQNNHVNNVMIKQEPHPFSNIDPQLSSTSSAFMNLTDLPKFPVPPGAKSSLVHAGLSQNQIDLLSALVAQHQTSLGNSIPNQTPPASITTTSMYSISASPSEFPIPQYSSSHRLLTSSNLSSTTSLLDPIGSSSSALSPATGSSSELDKKRRNTAASARFRFKKKLKEKQMETKIKGLEDLIVSLESQLTNFEMENKLLRNLIIEKGSQKSDDEVKQLREKARMD